MTAGSLTYPAESSWKLVALVVSRSSSESSLHGAFWTAHGFEQDLRQSIQKSIEFKLVSDEK